MGRRKIDHKEYIFCHCEHAADMHKCSQCGCREYWSGDMEKKFPFGRKHGPIKRGEDGIRRVVSK